MRNEWTGFVPGVWEKEIDVRDFIQKNYTPYDGDDAFLAGPTEDTKALWQQVLELSRAEREAGGVLDMDTRVISTITSHAAGYLDKEKETIVGFQTEKPFKRALMPYGGIRMAQKGLRGQRLSCGPGGRGIFYNTPQNAQRGRVRRIYARNAGLPLQPYHHRPAGRLRPGPHHRRLPPCGAVRRGPADRGQTAPEGHHPRHHVFRRHPRAGGAQRADPRAGRLEKAGGDLRLRYLPSGEGHP